MNYSDPNNLLVHHALNEGEDRYLDEVEDEFVGKMLRKRYERRGRKPHIQERRKRKNSKRIARGKPPRHPEVIEEKRPEKKPLQMQKVKKDPTAPKGSLANPINNKDLKSHKVMNAAVQNELKTAQEELKAEGLRKKVDQEDLKAEKLKEETKNLSMQRNGILALVVLGAVGLAVYLKKSKTGGDVSEGTNVTMKAA